MTLLNRPAELRFVCGLAVAAPLFLAGLQPATAEPDAERVRPPKVVLISLDGARPDLIQRYVQRRVLPAGGGLATLIREGVVARRNVTANPSLTAVAHIAIATGSTAVHNDIPANSFHPVGGAITSSISGFGAPIGGYELKPLGPDEEPTAEPLWVKLREAGKTVVAATWPGADGATSFVNGVAVQTPDPTRLVDYTVPFGAFGGLGAQGFSLDASDFAENADIATKLAAAGHPSFSPVRATPQPVETFTCSSATTATCSTFTPLDITFKIRVAAIDGTDDGVVNYDTLVFFDEASGIPAAAPKRPATGPAYVKLGGESGRFYLEGTGNKIGTAFYVTTLTPDLSTVRFVRYSSAYIPRNAPVLADVDDINEHSGFWAPQSDFRIPERLSPGFESFSDIELEATYTDQVKTFVRYQTAIAKRAIRRNPGADLVMIYFEQPDGSEHQFFLTDRRQATDPRQPTSIGRRQDENKVARYRGYVEFAYQQADRALSEVLELTGPQTSVMVVSDHGMAPFHTAVSLTNILKNAGVDVTKLAVRTSGPAANIYVSLKGREPDGVVGAKAYRALVNQVAAALRNARDPNQQFNQSLDRRKLFGTVITRPFDCAKGVGFCTDRDIGQDFGDVFAQLDLGYNFDGIQSPPVLRLGDAAVDPLTAALTVPNFYGAHGYDPRLPEMSATFIAAGPNIRRGATIGKVRNIDVAPTISRLLGVKPADTVDGDALREIFR